MTKDTKYHSRLRILAFSPFVNLRVLLGFMLFRIGP